MKSTKRPCKTFMKLSTTIAKMDKLWESLMEMIRSMEGRCLSYSMPSTMRKKWHLFTVTSLKSQTTLLLSLDLETKLLKNISERKNWELPRHSSAPTSWPSTWTYLRWPKRKISCTKMEHFSIMHMIGQLLRHCYNFLTQETYTYQRWFTSTGMTQALTMLS